MRSPAHVSAADIAALGVPRPARRCDAHPFSFVMAGLDPAIQQASVREKKNLDGRLKGGHDEEG
jgi:hypothetical protein